MRADDPRRGGDLGRLRQGLCRRSLRPSSLRPTCSASHIAGMPPPPPEFATSHTLPHTPGAPACVVTHMAPYRPSASKRMRCCCIPSRPSHHMFSHIRNLDLHPACGVRFSSARAFLQYGFPQFVS